MSARARGAAWLLTRLLLLALLLGGESRVVGDVVYFSHSLRDLSDLGWAHTLPEYPLPAVLVVGIPWVLAMPFGLPGPFGFLLVACVLAVDAAFTALLLRSPRRPRRDTAFWVWLLGMPALGAVGLARFDLVPGVLVGATILLAVERPRRAAAAAAVATAVKLWPVLLLGAVVARSRHRAASLGVIASVGAVAAGLTVLLGGWGRLLSPLGYQADRGLQLESVAATPAMVGWALHPSSWRLFYSPYKAYEVAGPGTHAALLASSVATALLLVAVAVGVATALRAPRPITMGVVVWLSLAVVTAFMAVGKVLSPQYFLWLLPAAAAGLLVLDASYRRLVRWVVVLLVAMALTHAVYPWCYLSLVEHDGASVPAVAVLAARNLLVLWLLVDAVRATRAALRTSAVAARPVSRTSPDRSAVRP